jgi:hypothetical protein
VLFSFLDDSTSLMYSCGGSNEEELKPEYLYFKLKEDMPKLEKYIQDPKYRKELEEDQDSGIGYTFYTNYELMDLLGLEKKVKRKIKYSRKFNNKI